MNHSSIAVLVPRPGARLQRSQRAKTLFARPAAAGVAVQASPKPALDWDNLGFGIQGVAPVSDEGVVGFKHTKGHGHMR